MASPRRFRVVLASPSDVQVERDAAGAVIDDLKQQLRDAGFPAYIELGRWETDAYPGLHVLGPQGLIDELLHIEDSDVFIGVFWQRFGTPVRNAESGTEHEILRAIEAWKAKEAPQVMLYFRDAPYRPPSQGEEEQFQKVQTFKQRLLLTDEPLVWGYKDEYDFRGQLHNHLWKFLMRQLRPQDRTDDPLSFLRVAVSANRVCAREEGVTELMGDLFLRCTYDAGSPPPRPIFLTLVLHASAPINPRALSPGGRCDIVLFEVGRPDAAEPILGASSLPGTVIFEVSLKDLRPHETRIFQISNLRCGAGSGPSGVRVHLTVTGVPVADSLQQVATLRKGLDFEVRTPDSSERLPDGGFEIRRAYGFTERKIATLRFTEGFANAFKSRAPILGYLWNKCDGDAVSTGESSAFCTVFAPEGGHMPWHPQPVFKPPVVVGLADSGTCLCADFHGLPAGVRIFVSVRELGGRIRARMVSPALAPGEGARMIGDLEVKELRIEGGRAQAVWEVITPSFYFEQSAGFLDFAVFACCAADPAGNLPQPGTSWVRGHFYPANPTSPQSQIPTFGFSSLPRFTLLTIAP